MITIPLELTEEQVGTIADALAARIGPQIGKRDAYSVDEVADRLNVSKATVIRRIHAGIIPTLPGISPMRIPADFVSRMMNQSPTNA